MSDDDAVKVHVDLANHPSIGGETLWADPVSGDLYRLANVPFWAYGLAFRDVVRATRDGTDGVLEVRELVEPSGNRTLRLRFDPSLERARQEELLGELHGPGVSLERADARLVAINVTPDGDYLAVFEHLEAWASEDLLDFETCQARVEGSFDDVLED